MNNLQPVLNMKTKAVTWTWFLTMLGISMASFALLTGRAALGLCIGLDIIYNVNFVVFEDDNQ